MDLRVQAPEPSSPFIILIREKESLAACSVSTVTWWKNLTQILEFQWDVLEKLHIDSQILEFWWGHAGRFSFILAFYQRDCARGANGGPFYEGEWPVYLIFSWADQPMKKFR